MSPLGAQRLRDFGQIVSSNAAEPISLPVGAQIVGACVPDRRCCGIGCGMARGGSSGQVSSAIHSAIHSHGVILDLADLSHCFSQDHSLELVEVWLLLRLFVYYLTAASVPLSIVAIPFSWTDRAYVGLPKWIVLLGVPTAFRGMMAAREVITGNYARDSRPAS
jgi:hypothetical protein